VVVNYTERSKLVSLPDAMSGRHYRKACCWSGECESLEEANVVL